MPAEVPEAGTYTITVAVRSDVVDHSLVQTETAPAVLEVDEEGNMRLSYRMVSGTEQEPMYILGFNGYYVNNEDTGELSMEGVTYSTEEAGEYQVVTDVSVPLTGDISRYYYNNVYIYVPAMSNLNGEISGIYFENGRFQRKKYHNHVLGYLNGAERRKRYGNFRRSGGEKLLPPLMWFPSRPPFPWARWIRLPTTSSLTKFPYPRRKKKGP